MSVFGQISDLERAGIGCLVIHLGHSPTGTCVKSVTLISCNELDIIIHITQHFRLGFFVFGVSSG